MHSPIPSRLVRFFGVLLVAIAARCVPPEARCEQPNTTRCAGAIVQICAPNRQWSVMLRCDTVAPTEGAAAFVCCEAQGETSGTLHTCVPPSECTPEGRVR